MWQMSTTPMGMRQTKHIFVGETRIATKNNWWQDTGTEYEKYNTYWYHADHLGSAQLVSNWKGEEYERIEYTPYGEIWVEKVKNGHESINYRFTGKEMDSETGLYYFGARYLDPKYSRWLSCDPALGEYLTPDDNKQYGAFDYVNLNLYHYGHNNPLKYKDPSGEKDVFSYFYDMCAMSYGSEGADYIMKNDTSVQVATTIDAAAKGDPKAQQILAAATKEGLKQTAVEGLEVTADVAGFVSEATGDMALAAVVVQPEVAGGLGLTADIASGTEIVARAGKALITGDKKDIDKAKSTAIRNGGSFAVGKIVSKKSNDAVGGFFSKVFEKVFDRNIKESNNKEPQE